MLLRTGPTTGARHALLAFTCCGESGSKLVCRITDVVAAGGTDATRGHRRTKEPGPQAFES
eukprot:14326025-Alexandrium_andersonii.AAC.1